MSGRDEKPRLRAISGAHHFNMALGAYHIIAAPREKPPFSVKGEVAEEDTYLVMSAPLKLPATREPLMRIKTRLIETRPREPGTVLLKGKNPVQLLAVIHDLNREPSWKEAWISHALERVLEIAEEQRLASIALPMLGTVHGTLEARKFMLLLGTALKAGNPFHLQRIWLVVPGETGLQTLEMLKHTLHDSFGA